MQSEEEFDSLLASAMRSSASTEGIDESVPSPEVIVAYVNGRSSQAETLAVRTAILAHPSVLDEVTRLCSAFGIPFPGVSEVVLVFPIAQITALATSDPTLRMAAAGVGSSGYHTSELWESPHADLALRESEGRLVGSVASPNGSPYPNVEVALERIGEDQSPHQVFLRHTDHDGSLDFGDLLAIPTLHHGEGYRLRVVFPSDD